jgi:hypothetical protein
MQKPRILAQLTPNERNPRTITDARKAALLKSYAEFGDLSGIVFNRRSGKLVGGHQRRSVLPPESGIVIEDRHKKPDALGTVARGYVQHGADRIPYREVDWPEAREKSAMIAANKHGGEFSGDLAQLLCELAKESADLSLTGFDDREFAQLLADITAPPSADGEKSPESKPPKSKPIDATYEVVISCADEAEQRLWFDKLTAEKAKCRLLTL